MGGNRATRFPLSSHDPRPRVPRMIRLSIGLVALAVSCGTQPATNDGGAGGGSAGGAATSGGSAMGGGTSGGSAGGASGGTSMGGGSSGGSAGGASGGLATSGGAAGGSIPDAGRGVDPSVILGELCDPLLERDFIVNCRLEPFNPFTAGRCLIGNWADGGTLTAADRTALVEQGTVEACSQFGARLLRCLTPTIAQCPAVRADGGITATDQLVQAALDRCNAQLGVRFTPGACRQSCEATLSTCQGACDRRFVDTCAPCSWNCGRDYTSCIRPCLVLPDAGYPDAG